MAERLARRLVQALPRALLADTTEALRPSWGKRQYAWIWAAMATKMVVQHVRELFDEVCRMAAMTRWRRMIRTRHRDNQLDPSGWAS